MAKKKATDRSPGGSPSDAQSAGRKKASPSRLRLLVLCPHCRRQYRATGWKAGTKFRCHCGQEVEIGCSRGHSADVIRCSSCGAPREKDAPCCGYCGADFTVHELDLNTVCPACLARISDKARFCHHCGTAITADLECGTATRFKCPSCGPQRTLVSRRLKNEDVTALECPRCVGLWLGLPSFGHLLEGEPRVGAKSSPTATPTPRAAKGGYRPCVECGDLMIRRNFGFGQSGVVVDVCGRHGLWFDADELTQLIAWIRTGGLQAAKDELAKLHSAPDRVRRRTVANRKTAVRSKPPPRMIGTTPEVDDDGFSALMRRAAEELDSFLRLFRAD